MSLPREPRQKMINMMYLVLTALLALNVSSEILNAFKTVNKSLENTNSTVDKSTVTLMTSLEEKMKDPATANRANLWHPRAKQAQDLSKEVFNYIQGLKDRILTEAGGDPKDPTKKFKEDNLDIVTNILIEKGEGKKLEDKLKKYRLAILGIDPSIDSAFSAVLPIDLTKPKSETRAGKTWEGAYFHMIPTVAGLTILSKFQMDVKTSENRVVQFCHNKVGEVNVVFDSYAAIIGQNSNYLMPGQQLEITAGVGAFSKKAQPIITIGGTATPIGEDGAAHTTLAGGGIGAHSVPIRITYMNQETGKMETIDKTVTYTVGQANASIALDKMNVLYIGVDNPVSIAASGGGDDKVKATITGGGGSISRVGPGKYSVRVNSVTDKAIITVTVDGKVAGASEFRVRTVPQSQAYVGGQPSGANMSAGQFRAQPSVGAGIKDFPFDLKYEVVSYTFTVDTDEGDIISIPATGYLFQGAIRQAIDRHVKAGKMVTIDNIRVKGPDGRTTSAPSLLYYIK
jgi:gliding motility-associated protein GldM